MKVTRTTNAVLSPKVGLCHIFRTGKPTNFKLDIGLQMEHKDPYHRQLQPPRSKIKVARSQDASDRCSPISRERRVPEIAQLVGRFTIVKEIFRIGVT